MVQGSWPSPCQPVVPIAPVGSSPLAWNFYEGQNLTYTPRPDAQYSALDLRRLASYPLARICIDNVIDILTRMPFRIQPKQMPGEPNSSVKKRAKGDKTISAITKFFERPNPNKSWPEFWSPILDDMIVCDNASILLRRTGDGKIAQLRYTIGDYITCYIDDSGYTPEPPSPAYAQLWNGIPRVNLTTDQLIYAPRNIRFDGTESSALYGQSPIEALATEIQIGINRLQWVLNFYTVGSMADILQIAPAGVDVDQIRTAMDWQNSQLSGDLAARRGHRIMQGFTTDGKDQVLFPKAGALSDPYDDLHIRKVAYGIGASAQRLLRMMNRAASESNQESAEEEGSDRYRFWMQEICNYIIQHHMGYPEHELAIRADAENDAQKAAETDNVLIRCGRATINDRKELAGEDRDPNPLADQLGTFGPTGEFVPLGAIPHAPEMSGVEPSDGEDATPPGLRAVPRGAPADSKKKSGRSASVTVN